MWHILAGTLDITIDGKTFVAGPGMAAVVPPNALHEVKVRTDAKVIVASHAVRERIRTHR